MGLACIAARRALCPLNRSATAPRALPVPQAALVNQVFVPLQLRVLWNNCVSLLWSTFLITHARSAEVSAERQLRHQLSLTKRI